MITNSKNVAPIDIDTLVIKSPEKALFAAVIDKAIKDAKGETPPWELKTVSYDVRETARDWIKNSDECDFYCYLIGIDRDAMYDRVSKDWS